MTIAPTAGAINNGTASQVTSETITVPSGILGGDVVFVWAVVVPISASVAAITAASTGTTPAAVPGGNITGSEPLPATVTGQLFSFIAAGTTGSASSDVGQVITLTYSVAGFPSTALQGYSGADTSAPADVINSAFGGANTLSVTCPVLSTGVNGDWAVFFGGGAAEGSGLTAMGIPAGSTARQNLVGSVNIGAAVTDSNAAVGAAGTSIGGGTFTATSGPNSILVALTVGLAPPSVAGPVFTGRGGPARSQVSRPGRRSKAAGTRAAAPLGTYRLFPSASGPSSPVSYSGNFLAGVLFKVTQGGMWFQGYWKWVAPGGDTVARKFALWTVDASHAGTLIPAATVMSGTLTAGQWNFIPLATPIPLAIGTAYNACTGWSAVNGFEDSDTSGAGTGAADSFGTGGHTAGITQGPLFAFSDGPGSGGTAYEPYIGAQGLFSVAGTDPTVNMPGGGSNSGNFWMDVQVSGTGPAGYPGPYRLYPNKIDANSVTTNDASVGYVIATEFRLSQPCALNKIWYYSPSGTTQLATSCRIWSIQGANAGTSIVTNTSPSWSGAAASGWVSCFFSGVILPAGAYKVSVYNDAGSPDGWGAKDASTNYWATGDGANGITWGPLSAPGLSIASPAYEFGGTGGSTPPFSSGTTEPGQSTFVNGTGDNYPYLYVDGLAQNYWLDVEVTPFTFYGQSKAAATARPLQKLPRGRGTGTKMSAPAGVSTSITGVTGTTTVTAPAGTVTAVTGTPGRVARTRPPMPGRGRGTGSFATASQPGVITGPPGTVTVAAPAGLVQAYAAIPGRAARPRLPPPRRGTGRGIFLTAPVPGVTAGPAGLIIATAPAGSITAAAGTAVAGPAGTITLTAVTGTVTAVTGIRGHPARSRTRMPRPARRGRGHRGTAGTAIPGTPGTVTLSGPPGTVTAGTGSPGKAIRPRTTAPPRRGAGHGRHGTAGTAIAAPPGTAAVTGTAGGTAVTVTGTPGLVIVSGPGGYVVQVPWRYTRWQIRPGFAPAGPRSHITAGPPGTVTVTAPAGTVTGT